jgi:RNA:NAD 2'-phosphotransferase (TPT1/KptA family)
MAVKQTQYCTESSVYRSKLRHQGTEYEKNLIDELIKKRKKGRYSLNLQEYLKATKLYARK